MNQTPSSRPGLACIVGGVFGLALALVLIGVAAFLVLNQTKSNAVNTVSAETPSPTAELATATAIVLAEETPTAAVNFVTATPAVTRGPAGTNAPIPTVTTLSVSPSLIPPQNVRLRNGNGPYMVARYMRAGQFVLDGQLIEWDTPGIDLTIAHMGPEMWTGPTDLSGTAWLGWDEQNLYLAAKVIDDAHVQTQTSWEMFRGDSVELWIDADLQGDFDQTQGDADDWQFGLSPGDFLVLRPEGVVYIPVRDLNLNRQIAVTAQPDGSGYTLEASIPWSILHIQPQHGMVLGYTIDLSDNDVPGTAQQQTEVTHNPRFRFNDPTTFGNLILQ